MDFPTLIRTTFQNLKKEKEEFEKSSKMIEKRKHFDAFLDNLTSLYKISKSISVDSTRTNNFRELIKLCAKEADVMKQKMGRPSTSTINLPRIPAKQTKITRSNTTNKLNEKKEPPIENALANAIIGEKPNVKWEDVAGLEFAKQTLKEAVIFPARFPQVFVGLRQPWKGILLYGVS